MTFHSQLFLGKSSSHVPGKPPTIIHRKSIEYPYNPKENRQKKNGKQLPKKRENWEPLHGSTDSASKVTASPCLKRSPSAIAGSSGEPSPSLTVTDSAWSGRWCTRKMVRKFENLVRNMLVEWYFWWDFDGILMGFWWDFWWDITEYNISNIINNIQQPVLVVKPEIQGVVHPLARSGFTSATCYRPSQRDGNMWPSQGWRYQEPCCKFWKIYCRRREVSKYEKWYLL